MDALPTRELTPLERALQNFNAGADPSAAGLQRAFLGARVCVLSSTEVLPDGSAPMHLLAVDGEDGELYLSVFTHEDRVDLEIGKRYRWMVNTTGENVLAFTTGGISINPGSDRTLAAAVKTAGVDELRALAATRQATVAARAARAPHELETAIAAVDRNGMNAEGILRFGVVLWPATLVVPSARPLSTPIDLDACFTFGPDDARMLAAFTDRDQVGEFAAPHLLEITAGELFHRMPSGTGIVFNPERPDALPLIGEGLRLIATLIERQAPSPQQATASSPPASPAAEPQPKRGLFGRRSD